jgi:zinc transport system substrate-binding protein
MPQVDQSQSRCRALQQVLPLLAILLLTLSPVHSSSNDSRLNVWVSILPQQWFAEQLAADFADIHVLLEPGQSPHTYDPSPRHLAAMAEADLLLCIGVPFEQTLIPRLENMYPHLRIVDVRDGIALRSVDDGCSDHDHSHQQLDPHVWLDPAAATIIARNMAQELCRIDSMHCDEYQSRLATIVDSLVVVDSISRVMLSEYRGRKLYVYHAAFGYWCAAYGLEQVPIEMGAREPGPRQVARLIESARVDNVSVVFVQPQFSDASARAIAAELKGSVVAIDPLAADYPENLLRMAAAVAGGLNPQEVEQ